MILLRKSDEVEFFCTGAFVNVVLPMVSGTPAFTIAVVAAALDIVFTSCGGDDGGFFRDTSLI